MPRFQIFIVLALAGLLGLPEVAWAQDEADPSSGRPDRRVRESEPSQDMRRENRRGMRPGLDRGMDRGRERTSSGRGNDPFDRRSDMETGRILRGWNDLKVHGEDGGIIEVDSLAPDEGVLVVVNGCLTCPKFLRSYPGMEAVARDHAGNEKVRFVYLYKTLAHPENDGFVQAFTIEERLAQMAEAKKRDE